MFVVNSFSLDRSVTISVRVGSQHRIKLRQQFWADPFRPQAQSAHSAPSTVGTLALFPSARAQLRQRDVGSAAHQFAQHLLVALQFNLRLACRIAMRRLKRVRCAPGGWIKRPRTQASLQPKRAATCADERHASYASATARRNSIEYAISKVSVGEGKGDCRAATKKGPTPLRAGPLSTWSQSPMPRER